MTNWGRISQTHRIIYVSPRSQKHGQSMVNWTNPERPRWRFLHIPNDILIGRASPDVPEGPFKDTYNPHQGVEFVKCIVESF